MTKAELLAIVRRQQTELRDQARRIEQMRNELLAARSELARHRPPPARVSPATVPARGAPGFVLAQRDRLKAELKPNRRSSYA